MIHVKIIDGLICLSFNIFSSTFAHFVSFLDISRLLFSPLSIKNFIISYEIILVFIFLT